MEVHYVDTSALVKLVRPEAGSDALVEWLASRRWVVGDLHRTELRRVAAQVGPVTAERAERLLAELEVVTVVGSTFDRAGLLPPPTLRSLDALHLACALELGDDLAGIVTYDERLSAAAVEHGIPTVAPR